MTTNGSNIFEKAKAAWAAIQAASGLIPGTAIAANTITANQMAANTITANQMAANTITPNQMSEGALGCAPTSVDHADEEGTALLTAPATGSALAFLCYVTCTENVAGATFQLGNGTDVDHFDDGTLYAASDAAGETFTVAGKLEPGEALTATPTVAGTAGAYLHTVLAAPVEATA